MQQKQAFLNGEVHSWYNFVLGYSDKLVGKVLDNFEVKTTQRVLDPFCGTGTTLVECARRNVQSVGIDANPFSCFVSRVKTHPHYRLTSIASALHDVQMNFPHALRADNEWQQDITYLYLRDSGMIERGWISKKPLKKALILKRLIGHHSPDRPTGNLLLLCLASLIASEIGNMRYGPEIYRGPMKEDVDPIPLLRHAVREVISDIAFSQVAPSASARVVCGDARDCAAVLQEANEEPVDYIITSPPYPTEHEYTRNTRLELALLGLLSSNDDVVEIKKHMIRSTTKNLYKADRDDIEVAENKRLQRLSAKIAETCRGKSSGFARLYPKIVLHYFGGIKRHLKSAKSALRRGGRYAMVVGDQASYHGVRVPTGSIIADLAKETGLNVVSSEVWRQRWATNGSRNVPERLLVFEKPKLTHSKMKSRRRSAQLAKPR